MKESHPLRQQDVFERILHVVIEVLGIWGLYAQSSVLLGRTFRELLAGVWIPAVALVALKIVQRRWQPVHRTKDESEEPYAGNPDGANKDHRLSPRTSQVVVLALLSITGMVILIPGNLPALALYAFCAAFLLYRMGHRVRASTVPQAYESNKYQAATVLLVIFASMIVTLCEHRVNWDDANYLQKIASALEHQDQPMLVYENLHGIEDLKINHPGWRLQTYELMVAAISKWFGISHLFVYYLALPPIWAGLAVIAQWSLIRRLAGRHASLALISTFVVLAVWGHHRSFGAFAFDFTGRGIFLTFTMPALISATLHFAENSSFKTWLYLFLTVWTACLFSSAAYALAPVAVCFVLIACYGVSLNKVQAFACGVLATIWCLFIMVYFVVIAPVVPAVNVDAPGGAHTVFRGMQGRIAYILFALAPFFVWMARLKSSPWMLRYSILTALVLLNGIVLEFIGKYYSGLSWRLLWAVPIPLIIGVGIAAGIHACKEHFTLFRKLGHGASLIILALIAFGFAMTGRTVLFNNFGSPAVKMDKSAFPTVRALANCSNSADLMLAPTEIAVPVAGFIGAPSLIAVRNHFLSRLSVQWGKEETRRRKRLFDAVNGKRNTPEDMEWVRNQILSTPINRIVLNRKNEQLASMRNMLRSLKFNKVELGSWELWLPHTTPQQAIKLQKCLEQSRN